MCIRDSYYRSWYKNGQVEFKGRLKKGVKTGLFTYYSENRKKIKEAHYKDDILHGPFVQWYPNGNKKTECGYQNGNLNTQYTSWYENGQPQENTIYNNGELIGEFTYWYENGNTKAKGTYVHGSLDGKYSAWTIEGNKLYEKSFESGQLHGISISWYENGNKETMTNYENGLKVGAFTDWFENGQMRQEGKFTNDEFFLSTRWNKEGGILIKDGNGKWEAKDSKGKKLWAKEYKDGRLVSDWEYEYEYFDNGNIKKEISFQGGKEDQSKTFFENGKIKEEGKWVEGEYLISNRWSSKGGLIIKDGQGRIKGSNKDGLVLYEQEYVDGKLEMKWDYKYDYFDNGDLKSQTGYSNGLKHGRYSVCLLYTSDAADE